VAAVGFDSQLPIAARVRPSMTTIALPHYEMGKCAFQLALGDAKRQGRYRAGDPALSSGRPHICVKGRHSELG
jgi:DNA-binding LacI/PurR family transcriptional regulator